MRCVSASAGHLLIVHGSPCFIRPPEAAEPGRAQALGSGKAGATSDLARCPRTAVSGPAWPHLIQRGRRTRRRRGTHLLVIGPSLRVVTGRVERGPVKDEPAVGD